MVIGENFAWAHLPKAAGDATLRLWRLFPELIVEADHRRTQAKHASFTERLDRIAGKRLFLNIRRLPAWNLSHAQHEARNGVYPQYKPLPMPTADQMAERTWADQTLAFFTDAGRLTIQSWLRQEMLHDDFARLAESLTSVSRSQRHAMQRIGLVNAAAYDHDLARWFTPAHIGRMYERNPAWAEIERHAYGNTLDDIFSSSASGLTEG
jgi:hypothetical protein